MDRGWLGTSPDGNKRKRADSQADYISLMMQCNPKQLLSESSLFNGLTQCQLPFHVTPIRGLPCPQYHAQIQLHFPDGKVSFGNGFAQTFIESTRVAAIDACKQLQDGQSKSFLICGDLTEREESQEQGLLVGVKKSNAESAGWGDNSNKTLVPSVAFRALPIILHSSGPDHAKNFVAELTVPLRNKGEVYFALGQGRKKAEAERACCTAACEKLHQLGFHQKRDEKEGDVARLIKHLNQFGEFKTIAAVVEYNRCVHDQIRGRLEKAIDWNSNKIEACYQQNVVQEVNELRAKAEEDKTKMEEKHKHDLEVHRNALLKAELQNKNLLWHHNVLIEKICEMTRAEVLTKQKSEDERLQCQRVRQEAQRQLEEVKKQAKNNAALQINQRIELKKTFEMHEGETKALVITPQDQKKKLVQKQNQELEKQRVAEMLEMEKGWEADKAIITDLEDQQEYLQSMINDLIFKERTSNDELEEARKVALKILRKYGSKEKIGIKEAGSIDKQPWEGPCRKKYMYDEIGWDMKMGILISEWEELLRDPCYWPLRVVEVAPNKCEFRVIEDDEKLKQLKEDLGNEVWKTVIDAFLEMEEYNASGRSPVEVAWDFEKNQRVVLKDLVLYLKELLDAPKGQSKALKRQSGY